MITAASQETADPFSPSFSSFSLSLSLSSFLLHTFFSPPSSFLLLHVTENWFYSLQDEHLQFVLPVPRASAHVPVAISWIYLHTVRNEFRKEKRGKLWETWQREGRREKKQRGKRGRWESEGGWEKIDDIIAWNSRWSGI